MKYFINSPDLENIELSENKNKYYPFHFFFHSYCNNHFGKKYFDFDDMIKTDKIESSIHFISQNLCSIQESKNIYFQDLDENTLKKFPKMKIIAIDPGKIDIINAGLGIDKATKQSEFLDTQETK